MACAFAGAVRGRRVGSSPVKAALHAVIIQRVGRRAARGRSVSNPDLQYGPTLNRCL
jgi:hypothetical protein